MYKIVIDANVRVKYARSRDIAPVLDRLVAYRFLPVVNNYLLAEIFDAVVENKWMKEKVAARLIELIRKIALPTVETAVYRLSPIRRTTIFLISPCKTIAFSLSPATPNCWVLVCPRFRCTVPGGF